MKAQSAFGMSCPISNCMQLRSRCNQSEYLIDVACLTFVSAHRQAPTNFFRTGKQSAGLYHQADSKLMSVCGRVCGLARRGGALEPYFQSITIDSTKKGSRKMGESTDIVAIDNGPLRVSGSFALKDAAGQEFDLTGRPAISLCRCGASANKPFCDGSHKSVSFESSVKAK